MDISEQVDYRHIQREECICYLAKFPQKPKPGCCDQVNVLVISEVTAKSVSMKLQGASRRRIQDLREDLEKSGRTSKHESFKKEAGSIGSVVLSDSDSSQSDGNVIDLTVVSETEDQDLVTKRPKKRPLGTSGDGIFGDDGDGDTEMFVEPGETSFQKVSLAPGGKAEDTLGKFRWMSKTTDAEMRSRSPVRSGGESTKWAFDETGSDIWVLSPPSSPSMAGNTRCKDCEKLYTRIRRQTPPKTKTRDNNPTSLSCDQWVLLKKWHPQRSRQRKKGLLWTSLVKIRKLAVQNFRNKTQNICSRSHVFQHRNLRRCKYLTSIQTDHRRITREKSRRRRRPRPAIWPPIGGRKPVKRKPSVKNSSSHQRLSPKLNISDPQKDKSLKFSSLNESFMENSGASLNQRNEKLQRRFDEQCEDIEGTRRVLRFDGTPEVVFVETTKQNRGPRRRFGSGEILEAQNSVGTRDSVGLQEGLFEDSTGFKTPTDLFTVKRKIKMKSLNEEKQRIDPDLRPSVQRANFVSLLAAMMKNRNNVSEETSQ